MLRTFYIGLCFILTTPRGRYNCPAFVVLFRHQVMSDSFAGTLDCSLPGSPVHGISQARILEQIAISPSPGDLPNPGMEIMSPAWQVDSFTTDPPGKPSTKFILPPEKDDDLILIMLTTFQQSPENMSAFQNADHQTLLYYLATPTTEKSRLIHLSQLYLILATPGFQSIVFS